MVKVYGLLIKKISNRIFVSYFSNDTRRFVFVSKQNEQKKNSSLN